MMTVKKPLLGVAITVLLAPVALAQPAEDTAPSPDANKVVMSRGDTIASAVARMAKAAGATAIVDPTLRGRVSADTAKLPLEQGLTAIASQNRAQWRKVYLAENEIPRKADGSVDFRGLKNLVAAISAPVAVANYGVVDPATGQLTVVTRAAENSPAMAAWLKGRKAVYVLYNPGRVVDAKPGGEGALPPGGPDALANMTPEQRMEWYRYHATAVSSDMTPEQRAQALQNLPPEQQQTIENAMNQAPQNGETTTSVTTFTEPVQTEERSPNP